MILLKRVVTVTQGHFATRERDGREFMLVESDHAVGLLCLPDAPRDESTGAVGPPLAVGCRRKALERLPRVGEPRVDIGRVSRHEPIGIGRGKVGSPGLGGDQA